MVIAPATLLALFGLGCGGKVVAEDRTQGAGDAGMSDASYADQVQPAVTMRFDGHAMWQYGGEALPAIEVRQRLGNRHRHLHHAGEDTVAIPG